jgi:dihydropteroate synthase
MKLRARQYSWEFPRPMLIMGIVNVTPDSFSDGGAYLDPDQAVRHACQLVAEGADILDIGGESTRPGAIPVAEAEELRRVLPVIERLAREVQVPLSIDTMKPAVAKAALELGASIINDVAASRNDTEMWRLARDSGAAYVAMHMQGTPQTMQKAPVYADVVREVNEFLGNRLAALEAFGLQRDQIVLDVGIGFGKTAEHNLQLLAALRSFAVWQRPLLLGVSRKGFIGQVTRVSSASDRLPGSLACACWGVMNGVNILRVHDVASTRQAVRMFENIVTNARPWSN